MSPIFPGQPACLRVAIRIIGKGCDDISAVSGRGGKPAAKIRRPGADTLTGGRIHRRRGEMVLCVIAEFYLVVQGVDGFREVNSWLILIPILPSHLP